MSGFILGAGSPGSERVSIDTAKVIDSHTVLR